MKDKDFKRWLKRKIKVTLGVMISFLILGKLGYADPEQPKPTIEDLQKEITKLKGTIEEQNKKLENAFKSKAIIEGEGANIGGNKTPTEKTEGIAIGQEATIDAQGGNGGHYSLAIGRKARIASNGEDFSSIALGDNANVLNGSGLQEWALSFDSDNWKIKPSKDFKKRILGIKDIDGINDRTRVPGGISIGTNTFARTGSIQIGSHTYSGLMGGIDVNDKTNGEANIVNMTTIGTNSYQKAAMGTMVGAYNISTGDFTGEGGINSLNYGGQNFGSSVFGSLNSIRSKGNDGTSGVANSIFGIANVTENTNGSLVFGAGNVVKNSNQYLKLTNGLTNSFKNVDEAVDKFKELIQKNNSGGSTLVIGGANKANYTKKVTMLGVNNKIEGSKEKTSESQMIIGSDNKVSEASKEIVLGTNYTLNKDNNILLGFNEKENTVNVGNIVAIGNDIEAKTENSVYLGHGSKNSLPFATIYGNQNAYEGILKDMHFSGATDKGVFSIGSDGNERVLQNVAPGLIEDNSTDAINGSQLSQVIKNSKFYLTKNGEKYEIKMGDTFNLDGVALTPKRRTRRSLQDRDADDNEKPFYEIEKELVLKKYGKENEELGLTDTDAGLYYDANGNKIMRIFYNIEDSAWNDVVPANVAYTARNILDRDKPIFLNFFATIKGKMNTVKSTKAYAGVANSIVGVANNVENSNGTLIYGAGNRVKESMEAVDTEIMALAYAKYKQDESTKNDKEIDVEKFTKIAIDLIDKKNNDDKTEYEKEKNKYFTGLYNGEYATLKALALQVFDENNSDEVSKVLSGMINKRFSGGATLVIGGGNTAETTKKTAIIGAANTIKNTEMTFVTGFGNEIGGTEKIQNNIITGSNYKVTKSNDILLGFNNAETEIKNENVVALGNNIKVSTDNSVYLGSKSGDSTNSIWSNGAYTKQTFDNNSIFNGANFAGTTGVNGIVSIGSTGSERVLQNVAAGKISSDSTDAVNGSQLYALAQKINNGGTTPAPTPSPTPTPQQSTTLNYVTVKEGKIDTEKPLTNITFNGLEVKVEESTAKSKDDNSKDVNVQTVTFSAKGEVKKDDKNLVDGGTVYNAISKIKVPDVTEINKNIEKIDKKSDLALGGVSNAVAMANLPQVMGNKKFNLAASYGYYGGSHAIAVGFSGTNDKQNFIYKLSGSVNNKGNLAFGIGAGVMLGEVNNKDKKIEDLTKENKEIKENLRNQSAEIQELKEIVKRLMKK
ncbi:YadA-like family protein [uncultured Sneathia sp.]|uniref:YadA-like family protein n=1 Tax=uncultured Sneathia sp. TaxID=278067 RepID=UPI002806115F|nr:YadA-like family protein [uncultured Sneathia sp.]